MCVTQNRRFSKHISYVAAWTSINLQETSARTTVTQKKKENGPIYSVFRPCPHSPVFKRKRSFFAPFSKRFASTLIVFISFSPVHTTTPYSFWKRFYTLSAHAHMDSTHAHFNISVRDVFSVRTRKWRFQKASFSNRSTLESVFEWLRFRLSFSAL